MTDKEKPDFSGKYMLDRRASSGSHAAAAVRNAHIRIEHREPVVRITATFEFDTKTFVYSLERLTDGREVVDETEPRMASSLHWEDNSLVFVDRTMGSDSDVTMCWRYELLDEGRRLIAAERIRGGGRDQDNVWVFERQ